METTTWLFKVKAAELHYNAAVARYDAVVSGHASFLHNRDAAHALWQAVLEKSGAKREYQHVLRTFTRLVMEGEVPPEV